MSMSGKIEINHEYVATMSRKRRRQVLSLFPKSHDKIKKGLERLKWEASSGDLDARIMLKAYDVYEQSGKAAADKVIFVLNAIRDADMTAANDT